MLTLLFSCRPAGGDVLHTLLLCEKMNFCTALVVCPLNTVLNWLNEFEKWQEGLKDEESLEVEIWYCVT